jgi:UDP-N-acetylmuramyl tripeptide synthase
MRAINAASRRTGRGSGTVAGGRVALRVSPNLLSRLSLHRAIGLVSGTNGKTTTTACLAAALASCGEVASNATGSNMLPGHVAALAATPGARRAALECDEIWLTHAIAIESPSVVVLLNLSRDQLDRTAEVRRVADAWRTSLTAYRGVCVANADDPLVVHAALEAPRVAWFAGGLAWGDDAIACPRCARGLVFSDAAWSCACGLARPELHAFPTDDGAVVDGETIVFDMALPGAFNKANGVGALLAAVRMGVDASVGARAIAALDEVAGRFSSITVGDVGARLLLAKNPAGWSALFDLVGAETAPVVVAVNARIADGLDTSWLYDVAFERLDGRRVIASGDRWRDLSARLFYAGIEHDCEPDVRAAIKRAGANGDRVEAICNYTAFAELRGVRP